MYKLHAGSRKYRYEPSVLNCDGLSSGNSEARPKSSRMVRTPGCSMSRDLPQSAHRKVALSPRQAPSLIPKIALARTVALTGRIVPPHVHRRGRNVFANSFAARRPSEGEFVLMAQTCAAASSLFGIEFLQLRQQVID